MTTLHKPCVAGWTALYKTTSQIAVMLRQKLSETRQQL